MICIVCGKVKYGEICFLLCEGSTVLKAGLSRWLNDLLTCLVDSVDLSLISACFMVGLDVWQIG